MLLMKLLHLLIFLCLWFPFLFLGLYCVTLITLSFDLKLCPISLLVGVIDVIPNHLTDIYIKNFLLSRWLIRFLKCRAQHSIILLELFRAYWRFWFLAVVHWSCNLFWMEGIIFPLICRLYLYIIQLLNNFVMDRTKYLRRRVLVNYCKVTTGNLNKFFFILIRVFTEEDVFF